ncbi:MAG: histone deacetylase family protein [Candidatus Levyibacteriota bacterium]
MKIIYSPLHKKHHPQYELYDGVKSSYPEVPERIEIIKHALENGKIGEFVLPKRFSTTYIDRVHLSNYRLFIEKKSKILKENSNFFPSDFIMDTYAPLTGGTYNAAKSAVDVALTGAKIVQNGERLVYSLCRPPGHHAGHTYMGGYCYFNNAAIAAEYLSDFGKVAILDIDYHHGNGTQQTFYHRSDVLYVSIHADPNKKFPYISGFANEIGIGEGKGYNKNYPLPLHASEELYLQTLKKAIENVVSYKPTYLIISLGFDTYVKDPIAGFALTIPFYERIGKEISSINVPTLLVQEGGYFLNDLGKIAICFCKGLDSKKKYERGERFD